MGACDDWVEFDGEVSTYSLVIEFEKHQQDLSYEHGNSYSGHLNMCPGLNTNLAIFNSYNEAEKFIIDRMQKWENAIGVRYYVNAQVKDNATQAKLRHKITTLTSILNNLNETIVNEVKNKLNKTEFIKCDNCRSKLDTRFKSNTLLCPVCHGSFASKSMKKKHQSLKLRLEELTKKLQNNAKVLQQNADKNRKTKWLVGGLCSS